MSADFRIRPPTPTQQAALGSALLHGSEALEAWRLLQDRSNYLDQTDVATFRLLPLVYRNLRNNGLDDDALGMLGSVYRQSWYRTRLAIATGLKSIATLREKSIEPIALKGLGLSASVYSESAIRPMGDVDLLIQPHQLEAAVETLFAAGMRATRGSQGDFVRRLKVFHAMPLVGSNAIEVDIHRVMLEENLGPGVDTGAIARLRTGSIGGVPVTTLSPEDHVLNACVHGARWDWSPALRWVPDTVWCVRATPSFDWRYLEAEAGRRGVSLALGAALQFASRYEPTIPANVVRSLLDKPHSRLESWDFRLQQAPDRAVAMAFRSVTRYARMTSTVPVLQRIAGFPVYYEWVWELDRPRQVPAEGIRRIWKRLRAR